MEQFAPLLLNIWREACRHIEISQFLRRIAPFLPARLPITGVVLRRFDWPAAAVETVAAESSGGAQQLPSVPQRTPCDAKAAEALLRWCRRGRVQIGQARVLVKTLPSLVPVPLDGALAAGPLLRDERAVGAVLLLGGEPFAERHLPLVQALLEPLAVALENDRQLRDLHCRREAAEAKSRSLLTRLDRQDISESVVGAETGLANVMERVALVAPAEAPVLIFGETGSGKEVVARAIHNGSRRAQGPFLRVNCGAIPPELVDSQLFGHERGSFTGAAASRKGWFERADGGTLFLDEVGELPAAAQVRLLRVLQDGSFERVGAQNQRRVDVRVVAATHRDLRHMASDGQFRHDLWYRLSVFPIQLPPLRDRPEDIPALATHFALRAAQRLGSPSLIPAPDDLQLLLGYPWPGNVRELAAVIERAVILGRGSRLEVATALGMGQMGSTGKESPPAAPCPPAAEATQPWQTLDQATRQHIEATLARTGGRIAGASGAAALLGVHPNTLRARMEKLGIRWHRFRPGVDA